MYDTYKEIFSARGHSYDKAMRTYPNARTEEFQNLFNSVSIEPHDIICDAPSGGGYLSTYLDTPAEIFSIDSCPEFMSGPRKNSTNLLISEPTNIAMKSQCFDHVLSLAGIHHMEDKTSFFREVQRLLKPGGKFCIADVSKNSNVSFFLDNIVDKYNSRGHSGSYLDKNTIDQISASGLIVTEAVVKNFFWRFSALQHAVNFCTLLFGLDKVDEKQLITELSTVLGITAFDNGIGLHWELLYISGVSK